MSSAVRRRSASATRAAILEAARTRFGRDGYERTSMRAVAGDVGVDPALVIRYFGNKQTLFADAAYLDLQIPDLTNVRPAELAQVLMPLIFATWEQNQAFLTLLRASVTNDRAAATMRTLFAKQVRPALSVLAVDQPDRRAALVGSQLLGLALSRYVLKTPPLVSMSQTDVTEWIGPVLNYYLTSP